MSGPSLEKTSIDQTFDLAGHTFSRQEKKFTPKDRKTIQSVQQDPASNLETNLNVSVPYDHLAALGFVIASTAALLLGHSASQYRNKSDDRKTEAAPQNDAKRHIKEKKLDQLLSHVTGAALGSAVGFAVHNFAMNPLLSRFSDLLPEPNRSLVDWGTTIAVGGLVWAFSRVVKEYYL